MEKSSLVIEIPSLYDARHITKVTTICRVSFMILTWAEYTDTDHSTPNSPSAPPLFPEIAKHCAWYNAQLNIRALTF